MRQVRINKPKAQDTPGRCPAGAPIPSGAGVPGVLSKHPASLSPPRQATWSQPIEQRFAHIERPDGHNPQ